MPDVEQRLLMHRLVLDDREGCFGMVEQRMARPIHVGILQRVDNTAVRLGGERAHLGSRRLRNPGAARLGGGRIGGIDAAREQGFERRIDTRASKALLYQRVERECRKMALVEDNRMAQGDRLAVVCLVCEQIDVVAHRTLEFGQSAFDKESHPPEIGCQRR